MSQCVCIIGLAIDCMDGLKTGLDSNHICFKSIRRQRRRLNVLIRGCFFFSSSSFFVLCVSLDIITTYRTLISPQGTSHYYKTNLLSSLRFCRRRRLDTNKIELNSKNLIEIRDKNDEYIYIYPIRRRDERKKHLY